MVNPPPFKGFEHTLCTRLYTLYIKTKSGTTILLVEPVGSTVERDHREWTCRHKCNAQATQAALETLRHAVLNAASAHAHMQAGCEVQQNMHAAAVTF
jgi:hypothetical protein